MKSNDYHIRELNMPADAEKLVAMWKASDDQWPGTWSQGVAITSKMMIEWHERINMLNIYVAETTDKSKIVGYGSISEQPKERNTAYLALLNVQPDFQGKSIGRRLVQKCVERCTELGHHLLTIETWPGNLKSVPTYKKCGYFWAPDTSVYMGNYIPAIRNLACAKPYFAKHDWYKTFKRELTQEEDDERWEGMKTFCYQWEADGDALTVWADREAHRLTAVETDTFFAGAIASDIEPAKGMSTTMRWRVTNKQDKPMHVSLIASGTDHIQVDKRATFTVAPGEIQELEATVDIALDTPDVKPGKPAPGVRSLFIIDGNVLELGTGLKPRKAVHVTTEPGHVTLFPGVAKTIYIQLQSYLKTDVEATVSLAPAQGLSTNWTEKTITISAKNFAAVPVTVQADADGVYQLRATIYFEGGQTKPTTLPVFSLPAGGVLAYQGEKETRLENEWTRVTIKPKSGGISLTSPQTDAWLGGFRERVGPPFWPNELDEKEFTIKLNQAPGSITAVMTVDLEDRAGLTLHRELILNGGPLVHVTSKLGNKGTQTHEVQMSTFVRPGMSDEGTFTAPLKDGLIQSHRCAFPAAEEDIGKKPEDFAERWMTYSNERGETLGLLWSEAVEETEVSPWGVDCISHKITCPPQQWVDGNTLYFYTGPGDWRTVRAHARRLAGTDSQPEPIPAMPRAVQEVRIEPAPILALDDVVKAEFVVDNLRGRPLIGKVNLALPDGVTADPVAFDVQELTLKKTLREAIVVKLPTQAAAHTAKAHLQTRIFDTTLPIPLIRLGNRDAVDVAEEGDTFVINNGRTRFGIAPKFSAALFQWEEDGINHVLSPYPEPTPFDWMSPWYGGITPIAKRPADHDWPGKLHREAFSGTAVDVEDAHGITWRGVRVGADLQREWMQALRVEIDYLTVGQSNVLKLIYRVHNSTSAKRRFLTGWLSFWQPDGTSEHNILRAEGLQRKPNTWDSWAKTDYWSTVTNGKTGRTVVQVSPYPHVGYIDWGSGGHLNYTETMEILPQSSIERVVYLALCPDLAMAKRYIALKDVAV